MFLTASITNHARWFSGSHSRSEGDINSNCSRSHSMKFWGMPRSFLNSPDGPGVYETASRECERVDEDHTRARLGRARALGRRSAEAFALRRVSRRLAALS